MYSLGTHYNLQQQPMLHHALLSGSAGNLKIYMTPNNTAANHISYDFYSSLLTALSAPLETAIAPRL